MVIDEFFLTGKSIQEIYESNFMKTILSLQSEQKILKAKERSDLSPLDLYILDSFQNMNRVISTLELFNFIIKEIRNFHSIFGKEAFIKMTKNDCDELQYHIENFYIRMSKFNDQILLFLNQIYLLNIDYKKCNTENIYNAIKLKVEVDSLDKLQVIQSLLLVKELKSKFIPIKSYRNYLSHRGEFRNDDLLLIQSVIYIRELKKDNKYPEELFENQMPEDDFKYILDGFIFNTAWKFRKFSNGLNLWAFSFFESCEYAFKFYCNKLK
jgi:hypothetical protein